MNWRAFFLWLAVPMAFALGVVCGRLPFARKHAIAVAPYTSDPINKKSSVAMANPVVTPEGIIEAAKKPSDTMERLKFVSEMNARLNSKFIIPPFTGDVLNADFVKMFGLTPAEEARLNAEIAAVKLRLAQLEASHATITPTDKGGLVVTIPPFPTEGGEVYNAFQNAFRDTLGAERFAYYQQMLGTGSQEDYNFGNFGLANSIIYVKPASEDPGTSSQWNSDQKTGLVTVRTEASISYLKSQRSELYQRLVAGGYVSDSPPVK